MPVRRFRSGALGGGYYKPHHFAPANKTFHGGKKGANFIGMGRGANFMSGAGLLQDIGAGIKNKIGDFASLFSQTKDKIRSPLKALEMLSKIPASMFGRITAKMAAGKNSNAVSGDGYSYNGNNGLDGGFAFLAPLLAFALPALKILVGGVATGAAAHGGTQLAKKIFGGGEVYGGGVSNRSDVMRRIFAKSGRRTHFGVMDNVNAQNNAHTFHKQMESLSNIHGGAFKFGNILGKVWGALKGIVAKNGVSGLKKIVSGAKAGINTMDLSKALTTNSSKLGEMTKDLAKKMGGNLKTVATEFGKTVVKDAGKAAGNIAVNHAEQYLDSFGKKGKKNAAKEAALKKAAAAKAESGADMDTATGVKQPSGKKRKAATNESADEIAAKKQNFEALPYKKPPSKRVLTIQDLSQRL